MAAGREEGRAAAGGGGRAGAKEGMAAGGAARGRRREGRGAGRAGREEVDGEAAAREAVSMKRASLGGGAPPEEPGVKVLPGVS